MKIEPRFSGKDVFFIVAGNMIGVGVFITPNWVASQTSSPLHYLYIWIIGAVIAITGGISYAALARTFPENGGDYLYLKQTSLKLLALCFASGMLWFVFPGSVASLALGAAEYSVSLAELFLFHTIQPDILRSWIAFIFIVILAGINLNRQQKAVNFQRIIVSILILSAGIFIIFSFMYENIPDNVNNDPEILLPETNWTMALLLCYFSFIGFASIGYIGGELAIKQSRLNRIMFYSVSLVGLFYIFLNVTYVLKIPFTSLRGEQASALQMVKNFPSFLKIFVLSAIIAAALGSLNVVMLTGGRLFDFIFKDNLKTGERSFFNISLVLFSAIGIFYLFTNSFQQILSGTTWSILLFSFITIFSFLIYAVRNYQQLHFKQSLFIWLAILIFTLASGWLSIYGFIRFMDDALQGFAYLLIGFFAIIVIFYSRFGKNLFKISMRE